jgi:diguanylate cyclase (GGDEF)-like protein
MRSMRPGLARRRRWTGIALVAALCIIGLGGSFAATTAVERAQQRHAGQLMDQYADEVSRAVTAEADRYRDTLSDTAAAVGAQSNFTATDFTEITSRLNRQRLPGAVGVAFAVSAGNTQITTVQAHWRALGASGLTLATVGSAHEHLFSIFNRSLDSSTAVAGRDLSQIPEPADALRLSRSTGQITASPTYILLKDRALTGDRQQMSFVLAAPVYGGLGTPDAGQFRGWMIMAMRGGDFIDETLRSQSRGAVAVTLTDLSTGTPTTVVQPPAGTAQQAGPLGRERLVTVGQRRWQLRLQPTAALLVSSDRRMPAVILGITVLITLLVAATTGILAGARNRAMNKFDHATTVLRDDIRRREATEGQLRDRESELRHLALHDPLTGLANRTLFHERVAHAIATHSRSTSTLAVLYIDLDGFKQINDNHGHGAGDAVLAEVAVRLRDCVRTGDTVARFGGDEFAVLTEQVTTIDDATIVADRIIGALQQPIIVDGRAHHITASAGVALHEQHTSADTTIRAADKAMYTAKTGGKNHYTIADPTLDLAGEPAAI